MELENVWHFYLIENLHNSIDYQKSLQLIFYQLTKRLTNRTALIYCNTSANSISQEINNYKEMPLEGRTHHEIVVHWFKNSTRTQHALLTPTQLITLAQAQTWTPVFVFSLFKPVWYIRLGAYLQLGHFLICCVSGSSPGAHFQNKIWQTEEWCLPESGPAGSQSLQPPLSRFNHIPGIPRIPVVCIHSIDFKNTVFNGSTTCG